MQVVVFACWPMSATWPEVCLPLGDMINHAPLPSASVEVQYHGASNMMRFQTTRPVAAGEEWPGDIFQISRTGRTGRKPQMPKTSLLSNGLEAIRRNSHAN
jgi:hypothetical protein